MAIEHIVTFVVILFALALLTDPLGRLLRLPHTALLVATGAVGAHVLTIGFGLDLGLRAGSFHDLVFYVFLPLLVFDSAYHLPRQALRGNLGMILFLAVAGMLLTALLSAGLIYWGIGHATGFPWLAALVTGALLAATDPVAVTAQLRAARAPERLAVLLEGESLFNDATAIVLFGLFLSLATSPAMEAGAVADAAAANAGAAAAAGQFLQVFLGGLLFGTVTGVFGAITLRLLRAEVSHALLLLTVAYGTYLLAERILHVSGIMAVLAAGLLSARATRNNVAAAAGREIGFTLGTLAYAASGCVFLLAGITVTGAMFTERWLAMLIAIGAVLVARWMVIFGGIGLSNLGAAVPVPLTHQSILAWGGLRGAVTLALALALPTTLDAWWTIQAMAYGVVLFTLFVQAPTMPMLIRASGVGKSAGD